MTDRAELEALLDEAAADLPGVAAADAEGGNRTWSRDGVPFAVLTAAGVDLRIGEVIADAAVRTPDTTRSPRGAEWVAFAPAELDDQALDRLEAWVAAAHRRATT